MKIFSYKTPIAGYFVKEIGAGIPLYAWTRICERVSEVNPLAEIQVYEMPSVPYKKNIYAKVTEKSKA